MSHQPQPDSYLDEIPRMEIFRPPISALKPSDALLKAAGREPSGGFNKEQTLTPFVLKAVRTSTASKNSLVPVVILAGLIFLLFKIN